MHSQLYKSVILAGLLALGASAAQAQIVEDGSFENQPPAWNDYSSTFGISNCTIASCGNSGGAAGPRTGPNWIWFGGTQGAETGYVRQQVTLPAGSGYTLRFWYQLQLCSESGNLQVEIDGGDALWQRDVASDECGASGYSQASVNLDAYAGQTVTLGFEFNKIQTTESTNFHIDDVSIEANAIALSITSTSPLQAGTIGQPYNAQLDATGGLQPLIWSATGLPSGLSLNEDTGEITGTPSASGSFTIEVTVTDSSTPDELTDTISLQLQVNAAVVTPAQVTPVPALGEWSLILLSILAGGLGLVAHRRKAKA